MQVAVPCAAILGFVMAEVGVSIQHDANHGAFSPCATLAFVALLGYFWVSPLPQ